MTDYEKSYVDAIVSEYSPKTTSKAQALKKLDRRAKLPANIFAYTFGVIAALLLGTGMCLSMNVIGGTTTFFVIGIIVGVIGIAMALVNYPIHRCVLTRGKEKYAEDILRLANEIKEG